MSKLMDNAGSLSTQENLWLLLAFTSMIAAETTPELHAAQPAATVVSKNGRSAAWVDHKLENDLMFAIGAMPEWIPADIRKASLRGQIATELSPQELQNVAQREGISVEELKKDEDFDPYLNVKLVLVEEGGQLSVGYFEFLPPSIWD